MRAYLVRVGIDSTPYSGGFNAPMNCETNEFAYVPIIEYRKPSGNHGRTLGEFREPCDRLGQSLPRRLWNMNAHIDPDFSELTYGDVDGIDLSTGKSNYRGRPLRNLQDNDILVFYAGLKPNHTATNAPGIIDAIVGLYIVKECMPAIRFAELGRSSSNAHTRCEHNEADIVVIAKGQQSGRLTRCIPIGGYRDKAHRVRRELLEIWGGLSAGDGYIQRSARLPQFKEPERFYDWLKRQLTERNIRLIQTNN